MREKIIFLISLVLISCNGGDGKNGKANASEEGAKTIYVYDANGQQLGILLGNQVGGSPAATITTLSHTEVQVFIPSLGYIINLNQHTGQITGCQLYFEGIDCTGNRFTANANMICQDEDGRYFVGLYGPYETSEEYSALISGSECCYVESGGIGGNIQCAYGQEVWYLTEEILQKDIPFSLPVVLPLKYVYK